MSKLTPQTAQQIADILQIVQNRTRVPGDMIAGIETLQALAKGGVTIDSEQVATPAPDPVSRTVHSIAERTQDAPFYGVMVWCVLSRGYLACMVTYDPKSGNPIMVPGSTTWDYASDVAGAIDGAWARVSSNYPEPPSGE